MSTWGKNGQKGQTLVWVALSLVALLIVLAMALDITHVYDERRHMQNAADAGALAGARELCIGNGPGAAAAKAYEYATAENAGLYPQDATVSVGSNDVTVVARERISLWFGGITGMGTFSVTARARAACGRVTEACGLWPVAFDLMMWQEMLPCNPYQVFYIWDDDKIVDCTKYQCDLDGDGKNEIVAGGDRGWLDLSGAVGAYRHECLQPGCGASELGCLIRNNSGIQISLPVCVSGDSGVKAGIQNDVNSRIGDTVGIPLFDTIGCSDPTGNCPGGIRFHVVSIGCVTILGWEQNLKLEPIVPPGEEKGKKTPLPPLIGKAIKVRMDCPQNCMSKCGSTDGTPALDWEYKAVSLVE